MNKGLPQLDFTQPARGPFVLDKPEIVVGQAADCGLTLDSAGVGEHHARLIVDGSNVWLENYEADAFTMHNGVRLTSRQLLADGDRIELGLAQAVFRAGQGAVVPATKAGNADRTMMGSEMPAELRQFLEQRKGVVPAPVGAASVPAPTPSPAPTPAPTQTTGPQRTVQMEASQVLSDRPVATATPTPARNYTVGTPDPEPTANRTVQMEATNFPGFEPAASKAPAPAPVAAAPKAPVKPYRAKATMMGVGLFTPPAAPAPTPAQDPLAVKTTSQASTAFMEAPVLPKPSPAPAPTAAKAAPQASTAFMEAPVLPKATPAPAAMAGKAAPQASTAFMEAPVLPIAAASASSAKTPVSTPIVAAPAASQQQASAPQPYTPQLAGPGHPYVPKDGGTLGSIRRAIGFMKQMFVMANENKTLLKPFYLDLAVTTAISVLISVCFLFVRSASGEYGLLAVGTAILYFVDYACNSLTASLIYDQVTTGRAEMSNAVPRVKAALGGVLVFAAVSAALDVASTYARERNDVLSKIILRILRAIWTTATYVIMPALVIEGISFKAAFARSKTLMDVDPTGVGSGVVALSLCSYAVGFVAFPLAYFAMNLGSHIHPVLGGILFFAFINLYWATTGWRKISSSTCFYLWARACAEEKGNDARLAPAPLRAALEAA